MPPPDADTPYRPPLAGVPAVVVAVPFALVIGAVFVGLALFTGAPLQEALITGGVAAVILEIGFAVLIAWSRRRPVPPGAVAAQHLQKALKTGVVPGDLDRADALARLDRSRRFWVGLTIASVVLFGTLSILGIWLVVSDPSKARSWVETFGFAAWTVYTVVQGRFQLRRIRRLRAVLEETPTT